MENTVIGLLGLDREYWEFGIIGIILIPLFLLLLELDKKAEGKWIDGFMPYLKAIAIYSFFLYFDLHPFVAFICTLMALPIIIRKRDLIKDKDK